MNSRTESDSNCATHSRVLDGDTKSVSKKWDFMLITENHEESIALCDGAAITEVLHERNGNDADVGAPSAAARHIATRSATGRLAKRPRKDLSPARSPPRKLGINVLFLCDRCTVWLLVCLIIFFSRDGTGLEL